MWKLVQKDKLSPAEKSRLDKCIEIISAKEKKDEEGLEERSLTPEEARKLYDETAGLLHVITDLKEIESGALKENMKCFQEQFDNQRVKDALWLEFLNKVSK